MEIVVETYKNVGENSSAGVRVRPLPGQGLPTDLRVSCSKAFRQQFPIGQLFLVPVMLKHTLGQESCLYVSYRRPDLMQPITRAQAREYMKRQFGETT